MIQVRITCDAVRCRRSAKVQYRISKRRLVVPSFPFPRGWACLNNKYWCSRHHLIKDF